MDDTTPVERGIWDELWASPQAVAWESLGWFRTVARYAQVLLVCEDPETATASMLAEARQLEDRLGLSPMAMRRLQWEIAEAPGTSGRDAQVSAVVDYRNL
nr:hypothetical protein [Nocardia sp. CY41]